jgi:hypothetical protein
MTYKDLYELTQDQVSDTTAASLLRIKKYLNLAQKQVAGARENWRGLQSSSTFTTVAGTEEYTLGTDVYKIRNVRITDTDKESVLQEVNFQEQVEQYPETTDDSQSTPFRWYISDEVAGLPQKIKLFPIPDAALEVTYDYYTNVTDMSDINDVPFFPARWHHVLVDFACARYFERDQEFTSASYYETKYRNGLQELLSDTITDSVNKPIMLGG